MPSDKLLQVLDDYVYPHCLTFGKTSFILEKEWKRNACPAQQGLQTENQSMSDPWLIFSSHTPSFLRFTTCFDHNTRVKSREFTAFIKWESLSWEDAGMTCSTARITTHDVHVCVTISRLGCDSETERLRVWKLTATSSTEDKEGDLFQH